MHHSLPHRLSLYSPVQDSNVRLEEILSARSKEKHVRFFPVIHASRVLVSSPHLIPLLSVSNHLFYSRMYLPFPMQNSSSSENNAKTTINA
jgi:hypothetical protein